MKTSSRGKHTITEEEYAQIVADGSYKTQKLCTGCGQPLTYNNKAPTKRVKKTGDIRCSNCVEFKFAAEDTERKVAEWAREKRIRQRAKTLLRRKLIDDAAKRKRREETES